MNGVKKRLRIRLFYDANQETGRQGGNKSKGRECALPYQYLVTIWDTFIVESWDDNINDKKRWTASGQPRPWASVFPEALAKGCIFQLSLKNPVRSHRLSEIVFPNDYSLLISL